MKLAIEHVAEEQPLGAFGGVALRSASHLPAARSSSRRRVSGRRSSPRTMASASSFSRVSRTAGGCPVSPALAVAVVAFALVVVVEALASPVPAARPLTHRARPAGAGFELRKVQKFSSSPHTAHAVSFLVGSSSVGALRHSSQQHVPVDDDRDTHHPRASHRSRLIVTIEVRDHSARLYRSMSASRSAGPRARRTTIPSMRSERVQLHRQLSAIASRFARRRSLRSSGLPPSSVVESLRPERLAQA